MTKLYVAEWRKTKALSLEDVASRVGIDKATLSAIETGQRDVTVKTLEKIAEAIHCEVSDLFRTPT